MQQPNPVAQPEDMSAFRVDPVPADSAGSQDQLHSARLSMPLNQLAVAVASESLDALEPRPPAYHHEEKGRLDQELPPPYDSRHLNALSEPIVTAEPSRVDGDSLLPTPAMSPGHLPTSPVQSEARLNHGRCVGPDEEDLWRTQRVKTPPALHVCLWLRTSTAIVMASCKIRHSPCRNLRPYVD